MTCLPKMPTPTSNPWVNGLMPPVDELHGRLTAIIGRELPGVSATLRTALASMLITELDLGSCLVCQKRHNAGSGSCINYDAE
jgi:hypothetical protein